ncbi:Protein argonaute-1 [Chionoecetes opilio]|uniref:Protein argonaute-1 n=1 Tax=Chionoecetes opilio TaxID=41210 RepID=A0A8J4YP90_CHIOP|nr:Protein argonaute-1 [Chionoecetes opilio]
MTKAPGPPGPPGPPTGPGGPPGPAGPPVPRPITLPPGPTPATGPITTIVAPAATTPTVATGTGISALLPPELPTFVAPRRPNLGREGRPITLRANHFQISMPRGYIHHYDVSIQPDKCPRKVNREIIETMVHAFPRIFGSLKVRQG